MMVLDDFIGAIQELVCIGHEMGFGGRDGISSLNGVDRRRRLAQLNTCSAYRIIKPFVAWKFSAHATAL